MGASSTGSLLQLNYFDVPFNLIILIGCDVRLGWGRWHSHRKFNGEKMSDAWCR